jgi:hypothetical protein
MSASNCLFRSNNSSFYPALIEEEGDGGWQRLSILFWVETVSVMRFWVGLLISVTSNFSISSPFNGLFCSNNSSIYPALNGDGGDGGCQWLPILF